MQDAGSWPEVRHRPAEPLPPWMRALHTAEDWSVRASFALMVALPLLEIALRASGRIGIEGSTAFVQHCVLLVGMFGAALAARQQRLLSLSALANLLPARARAPAAFYGNVVAAVIAACLCAAGVVFVKSEREAVAKLGYGIPVWWLELVIPLGFALIAARLCWSAGKSWKARAASCALVAAALAFANAGPCSPAELRAPALVALALATLLGTPIFAVLGGAALILFWADGTPTVTLSISHYGLATNVTLPSLPLFTLVGYFLAEGGASKRLVRVFQALFGGLRGGTAIATAFACAFFTTFTGASGVTILALGGLLLPALISSGMKERTALGLLTGAGSLGLLFPPCMPLILYKIVAGLNGATELTIEQMFLGGILPGVLLLALTIAWGVLKSPSGGAGAGLAAPDGRAARFDAREALVAVWEAKWELLVPVVALLALFSGWCTPVEAAAVTAFYAFAIETFVHRDLNLRKDVPRVLSECGLLIGGVLLIMGVALGLTSWLIDAQIPDLAVEWVMAHVSSKWEFLLYLNIVLLFVGGLMEIYAAIFVVVPILVPIGTAYGIEPVHLGIMFLANMELGFLAPPVGMNLLLASYRFKKPMGEVTRASLPMLAVLGFGVLAITYLPWLTTWLPGLLAR